MPSIVSVAQMFGWRIALGLRMCRQAGFQSFPLGLQPNFSEGCTIKTSIQAAHQQQE